MIKNCNLLIPSHQKRRLRLKLQEKPSPWKEDIQHFKTWHFLPFHYFCGSFSLWRGKGRGGGHKPVITKEPWMWVYSILLRLLDHCVLIDDLATFKKRYNAWSSSLDAVLFSLEDMLCSCLDVQCLSGWIGGKINDILNYFFLFYSILFYSILFYFILFYFILFYSIDEPLLAQLRKGENLNIAVSHHQLQQVHTSPPCIKHLNHGHHRDTKAKWRHRKNWPVKNFAVGVYQSF